MDLFSFGLHATIGFEQNAIFYFLSNWAMHGKFKLKDVVLCFSYSDVKITRFEPRLLNIKGI